MSTQGFGEGATRQIQPGDTPDLNDGLLSRTAAVDDILRGEACYIIDGLVTVAAAGNEEQGRAPFVPIESVANAGDLDLPISGVVAPQRVALRVEADSDELFPGDYVKISATNGQVEKFDAGGTTNDDDFWLKYARYLGKEAALLDKQPGTPFAESLSTGIVPDESLDPSSDVSGDENVGWFQLIENQGGKVVATT